MIGSWQWEPTTGLILQALAIPREIEFHDDGTWTYSEDTALIVQGASEPFIHQDHNRMTKIGEPDLNPWLKIMRGGR